MEHRNVIDSRIKGHLRILLEKAELAYDQDRSHYYSIAREAFDYAKKQGDEFGERVALRVVADASSYLGNIREAIVTLNELREANEKENEFTELALDTELLGECHRLIHDYHQAETEFLHSIHLFEQHDLLYFLQRVSGRLATVYFETNRYIESVELLYRAKEVAKKAGLENTRSWNRLNFLLGIVSGIIGNHSEAREYFTQVLSFEREFGNVFTVASILCNIGVSFADQSEDAQAIEYFLQALELNLLSPDIMTRISILSNIAESYSSLGNFVEAEVRISEAYRISMEEAGKHSLCNILHIWAKIKIAQNDEAAVALLQQALLISREINDREEERELLIDLSEFHNKSGNFEIALKYYREWHDIILYLSEEKLRSSSHLQEKLQIEQRIQAEKIITLKLESREKELSHQAIQLVTQTELLAKFRDELREIVRKYPSTEPGMREVKEKLKDLPCKSIDWEEFEKHFSGLHPEFTKNLANRYPNLTPMQMKMCPLLRLNLKSYEIARLFCITERAVEFHRLNIRKKLSLAKEQNLASALGSL
ncbi:MAG: hypothetical protein Q8896_01725 [Bacteroidota bacterium]|nr:hypothetical protein [Bacteroidota bacterium]